MKATDKALEHYVQACVGSLIFMFYDVKKYNKLHFIMMSKYLIRVNFDHNELITFICDDSIIIELACNGHVYIITYYHVMLIHIKC